MKQPHVLITNDDGIDSYFLQVLVEAHRPHFRVSVAAPVGEQSWIGRAFSRLREVRVERVCEEGFDAWAVDGTPSDCVNIALGHLLDARPDVVISGINIGFNATMPLSLSSGTLAGAVEGAGWGIPAVAFSLMLPNAAFESIRLQQGRVEGEIGESLLAAATRAVAFTQAAVVRRKVPVQMVVDNVNFPERCDAGTTVERTVPAVLPWGSLYQRDAAGSFRFKWQRGDMILNAEENTDVACLERGNISHSVLDYATLGRVGGIC